MKRSTRGARTLSLVAALALAGTLIGAVPDTRAKPTDQLVVLSTTDVEGHCEDCGCHVPKGALSRRVSLRDSLSGMTAPLLFVENGGFVPTPSDTLFGLRAAFMFGLLAHVGVDAAGISERELQYGRGWLLTQLEESKLPVVCANIHDRIAARTLVPAYRLIRKGRVTVGVFGLASDDGGLGPARDSLLFEDPKTAAKRTVAALRSRGATVIVLLSHLGVQGSEELAASVPGIDLMVVGRNAPVGQPGGTIGGTLLCYGGQFGQYAGHSVLTLGRDGHMTSGACDMVMVGPELRPDPRVAGLVNLFSQRLAALYDQERARPRDGVTPEH